MGKKMCFRVVIGTVAASLAIVPFAIESFACSYAYPIWGIRDRSADPLFRFVRNGKSGYIDARGKIAIPALLPLGDNFRGQFHQGLAPIEVNGFIRYYDRNGVEAFRLDAWLAFDFSEGFAPASKRDEHNNPKWGFVDRTGRFVIAPQYSWVDGFSEGLAKVSVSGETGSVGYVDHSGKFVIPANLSYGSDFHDGLTAVVADGPCRIVNGGSCGPPELYPSNPGALVLSLFGLGYDCRWIFVDKEGKRVSYARYDYAGDFSEGFAAVRIGAKWGYSDKSGRNAVAPEFDWAGDFSEGLAAVSQGGKIGFIDRGGHFAIAPQYSMAGAFSDGRALITELREDHSISYRYIDRSGHPAFNGAYPLASGFTHGLAHVALSKDTFAWIDTSGTPVFKYRAK